MTPQPAVKVLTLLKKIKKVKNSHFHPPHGGKVLCIDQWRLCDDLWKLCADLWRLCADLWKLCVDLWKLHVDLWKLRDGLWKLRVDQWKLLRECEKLEALEGCADVDDLWRLEMGDEEQWEQGWLR